MQILFLFPHYKYINVYTILILFPVKDNPYLHKMYVEYPM